MGVVTAALGVLFLLDTLDIWGFRMRDVWQFWPVLLLFIGARILVGGKKARSRRVSAQRSVDGSGPGELNITCLFGETDQRVTNRDFSGGEVTTIDLFDALPSDGEATINVTVVFGGVTLRVPGNWTIDLQTTNLSGGVEDKHSRPPPDAAGGRIVLTGVCLFGHISLES